MEELTFAVVLTAAGATASAALITGLIAIAEAARRRRPLDRRCPGADGCVRSVGGARQRGGGLGRRVHPGRPVRCIPGVVRNRADCHGCPRHRQERDDGRRDAVRDGYLRGTLPATPTARQVDVLAAYVAAGGSVAEAAARVGVRPSTAKRHLADLRARSGLTTEQLIYRGRAEGWLVVSSLEPD